MKSIPTLFIAIYWTFSSFAQVIYFDSTWKVVPSKEQASYYREVKNKKGLYHVTDFYISGQRQMTGTYLDSSCNIKHGSFVYYYMNGKKASQGPYENNEKYGHWMGWQENGEPWIETMPEFPGGVSALIQYLKDNVKYPEYARENGIKGRVIIQFVTSTDGSIEQIEVLKSIHPTLDAEAVRVVSEMPKWIPGTQNGKPVFVRFSLPISFKL